jgi:hypothetical protein
LIKLARIRPPDIPGPTNFFSPFCALRPKCRPLGNTGWLC